MLKQEENRKWHIFSISAEEYPHSQVHQSIWMLIWMLRLCTLLLLPHQDATLFSFLRKIVLRRKSRMFMLCHYGHHRQETRQSPWGKVMYIMQSAFLEYSPTSCPKRMLEVSPIITSKPSYLLSRIHQNSFMGTGLAFRCQLSCSHSWGGGGWPCAAVS